MPCAPVPTARKPSPLEGEGRVGGGRGRRTAVAGKNLPAESDVIAPLTPHPTLPLKGGGKETADSSKNETVLPAPSGRPTRESDVRGPL